MNQCCLIWEISTIEGEHYNPITYAIYAVSYTHLYRRQMQINDTPTPVR